MAGKSALILGATGAVGKNLLREVLTSPQFTRVAEFGRRITPEDQLKGLPREKLVQRTMDYEKLGEAGLRDEQWDVVFITMGTSRKQAGGAEQFVKIDQEYVVNAARAAKHPQQEQRLVYLSSVGANANSHFLYPQSKGQTENALASLGYSDTVIFRPGGLQQADRGAESRPFEAIANVIVGSLSVLSDSISIPVKTLAKSMRIAGDIGSSALPAAAEAYKAGGKAGVPEFTVIGNKGSIRLAKTPSDGLSSPET